MSKDSATVIKDGQLAVATVPQTGTLVGAASEIDATALVETADGLQLCVKTCEVGGGGGGGGTVDQTYDSTSTNAQSGTAVAEAVQPALKNTATGTDSLTILGVTSNSISATNIGKGSEASASYTTVLGNSAYARGERSTVLGMGANDHYNRKCTLIGSYTHADDSAPYGIAIGTLVRVAASGAIQLGNNTDSYIINSTPNSFQVFNYQMLDGNTGKIPMARFPIVQLTQADYDALVSGGTVDANTIYCIIPS